MKMISKAFIHILSLIFLCNILNAQVSSQYEIINTISSQDFNNKIPLLDSLYPLQKMPFLKKDLTLFCKKEVKELNNNIHHSIGFKLNKDSIHYNNIISALPIFNAIKNLNDTINLNVVTKAKPFYMVSNPIFFSDNTKAIISVLLVGGLSSTYILKREKNRWSVVRNVCQMMQ